MEFLEKEKCSGKKIFPPEEKVFAALNLCPFDKVRVVLLGQDPYHDDGQAMGLSFSVPRGYTSRSDLLYCTERPHSASIDPPPSLKNIFKELKSDLGIDPPSQGERHAMR
jgi:uracil-DNA glycosylase